MKQQKRLIKQKKEADRKVDDLLARHLKKLKENK